MVISNWAGSEWQVEAPNDVTTELKTTPEKKIVCEVQKTSGTGRPFILKLKTSLPVRFQIVFRFPEVQITQAETIGRWVALVGRGLMPEKGGPGQKISPSELTFWPLPWGRGQIKHIWNLEETNERVSFQMEPTIASPAVEVLAAEQEAFLGQGPRWLHKGRYSLWVYQKGSFFFRLPPQAQLVTATWEGKRVFPRLVRPGVFQLNTKSNQPVHRLVLCWKFSDKAEHFVQPNFSRVEFQEVTDYSLLCSLWIPPGMSLPNQEPENAGMEEITRHLQQAENQWRICKTLLSRKEVVESQNLLPLLDHTQQRFLYHYEQASALLRWDPSEKLPSPGKEKLTQLLKALQQKNLKLFKENKILSPDFPKNRGKVEFLGNGISETIPTFARSLVTWDVGGQDSLPQPILISDPEQFHQQQVRISEMLLLLLFAAGLLSFLPKVIPFLHRIWPEQIVLLSLLGLRFWGVSVLGLALVVVGVLARLVFLALGLRRWWFRRKKESSSVNPQLSSNL